MLDDKTFEEIGKELYCSVCSEPGQPGSEGLEHLGCGGTFMSLQAHASLALVGQPHQAIPHWGEKAADRWVSDLFRKPMLLDCPRCKGEKFYVIVGRPGPEQRAVLQCPDCRTSALNIYADASNLSGLVQFRCSFCTVHWNPAEMRVFEEGLPENDRPDSFVRFRCYRQTCPTWMPLVQLRKPQLDDYRAKNLGLYVPDPTP